MGNLEKAGVLVVVVLLAVIMVVAFVSDPGDAVDPGREDGTQTASRTDERTPSATAPGLQHQRRVDQGPPSGGQPNPVLDDDIVDVTPEPGGSPASSGGAVTPVGNEEGSRPVSPGTDPGGEVADGPGLGEPASASPREIKVQPGDSLWKIAARSYGVRNADAMALAIQKENDIGDPLALRQGMTLVLPAVPSGLSSAASSPGVASGAAESAPAAGGGGLLPFDPGPVTPVAPRASSGGSGSSGGGEQPGTYVVRSGDTLGEIAVSTMGSTKFVKEIMRLNEIADAGKIRAGMVLNIPPRSR